MLASGRDAITWRLVSAFLVGYPPHSSRAYFGDLKAWYAWCAAADVHPLQARRHHVDVWCATSPRPRSQRPAGRRRRRRSPGGCRAPRIEFSDFGGPGEHPRKPSSLLIRKGSHQLRQTLSQFPSRGELQKSLGAGQLEQAFGRKKGLRRGVRRP